MGKERMEVFSDGVLAIIITIMVLELRPPHATEPAALRPLLPVLLSYVLSFVFLGLYWNNHHHMLSCTRRVTGAILWANLHLLFWLSLVPFVTAWMGEHPFASTPAALYGVVLVMAGIAYLILQRQILRSEGPESVLAAALGRDRKGKLSPLLCAVAIGIAFISPGLAYALYLLVALAWLIPDRRIERVLSRPEAGSEAPGAA
jgi:uncharacterized membrane protein